MEDPSKHRYTVHFWIAFCTVHIVFLYCFKFIFPYDCDFNCAATFSANIDMKYYCYDMKNILCERESTLVYFALFIALSDVFALIGILNKRTTFTQDYFKFNNMYYRFTFLVIVWLPILSTTKFLFSTSSYSNMHYWSFVSYILLANKLHVIIALFYSVRRTLHSNVSLAFPITDIFLEYFCIVYGICQLHLSFNTTDKEFEESYLSLGQLAVFINVSSTIWKYGKSRLEKTTLKDAAITSSISIFSSYVISFRQLHVLLPIVAFTPNAMIVRLIKLYEMTILLELVVNEAQYVVIAEFIRFCIFVGLFTQMWVCGTYIYVGILNISSRRQYNEMDNYVVVLKDILNYRRVLTALRK